MTSAAKCGSVVSFLACLVATGALAPDTSSAPVVRGAAPFGAIDVSGSVTHLKLDDTGGRLLISTVRYAEGGRHADLDPAFAPDGGLVALRAGDGRLAAVDVESERVLLAVEDPPSRSVRRAALLFGLRGGYLAVSGPDGVVLHTMASGEPAAVLPLPDPVWRIAMSGNGRVVAVATQHRITLWRLTPGA
jgi:hypothetical protein